ncbi:MAG TPA: hypothetical protein VD965_10760 [Burkholderiales bacterium]|nr:hypothetical protein [Burkholderiales bacterium]
MSAAATAAGYLYASGRLRGRNAQESDQKHDDKPKGRKPRVGVIAEEQQPREHAEPAHQHAAAQPRKTPKIQYRNRRRTFTPDGKPDDHA